MDVITYPINSCYCMRCFWVCHLQGVAAPDRKINYGDVIMSAMASQITAVSIVFSAVCSGFDQRKHQSSALLAFVRGIHRWLVDSPHKGTVTRKMFPFDDVIMLCEIYLLGWQSISFRSNLNNDRLTAKLTESSNNGWLAHLYHHLT